MEVTAPSLPMTGQGPGLSFPLLSVAASSSVKWQGPCKIQGPLTPSQQSSSKQWGWVTSALGPTSWGCSLVPQPSWQFCKLTIFLFSSSNLFLLPSTKEAKSSRSMRDRGAGGESGGRVSRSITYVKLSSSTSYTSFYTAGFLGAFNNAMSSWPPEENIVHLGCHKPSFSQTLFCESTATWSSWHWGFSRVSLSVVYV